MRGNDFNPNWASMPGDTIADILSTKNLTLSEFSRLMNSNQSEVKQLLHGFIAINEPIAIKLHKALGGSKDFWLKREEQYRQSVEKLRQTEESKWIEELPTSDMIKFGWIKKGSNLIESCLEYFGVPDVWTWRKKYSEVVAMSAFRKSDSFLSTPGSLATWIRQGEKQAESVDCAPWNPDKFVDCFGDIKKLSKIKEPKKFIPLLKKICENSGIALIIAPTPKGCSASGVAKFLSSQKAMILLSFRYKSDDHFWFTFFHEAAHLLLHSHKEIFIEFEKNIREVSKEEKEANEYSSLVLISADLRKDMQTMSIDEKSIKHIASTSGISLGIVVGQLQHLGKIKPSHYNSFKRRYDLSEIF
jgi:plasmid maintenance system antidote protein VapI/Zn-dependent peptidase ImmA (M78 family)